MVGKWGRRTELGRGKDAGERRREAESRPASQRHTQGEGVAHGEGGRRLSSPSPSPPPAPRGPL